MIPSLTYPYDRKYILFHTISILSFIPSLSSFSYHLYPHFIPSLPYFSYLLPYLQQSRHLTISSQSIMLNSSPFLFFSLSLYTLHLIIIFHDYLLPRGHNRLPCRTLWLSGVVAHISASGVGQVHLVLLW